MVTIVIELKPIASDKWHESSPVVILLSNQHPVQRVAANVPGRVNFSELHAGNYQIQVKVNSTSYEYSIQLVATRT